MDGETNKAKATVSLSRTTWRAFRAACIRRGVSASSVIETAIDAVLEGWANNEQQQGPSEHRATRYDRYSQAPGGGTGRGAQD